MKKNNNLGRAYCIFGLFMTVAYIAMSLLL